MELLKDRFLDRIWKTRLRGTQRWKKKKKKNHAWFSTETLSERWKIINLKSAVLELASDPAGHKTRWPSEPVEELDSDIKN